MIGRTFAHYRILASLGSGGMGEVYRARDTHLDRDVAVKVLPADLLPDDDARRRFRREALALSRIEHPHIAVVHDFAEEAGVAFLVMELIEGESLERRLARGPLPEPEVRRIGGQVAAALAAAHAQAIVHRDLKPSNIMLTRQGDVKVLDFGIAKHLATPDGSTRSTQLTDPNALVGTLPYMAPEQLRGGPVDARTDVFALGTTLYEMATGRRPFAGATTIALADAILHQVPERASASRPELAASLESAIHRCLEKEPERRFPSATAVAEALAGVGTSADAPQPTPDSADAAGMQPGAPAAGHSTGTARPAQTIRWGVASVAVILVAVLATILVPRLLDRFGSGGTIRSLAVLPLENISRDPDEEFFAEGMTDELIVSLQSIEALRVISRSSSKALKGAGLSAAQIGRRLNVDALVTGSIQRAGGRVRIRAQLVRARTDQSLWAASFERDGSDALALQTDIALAIVEKVRARLRPAEKARLDAPARVDPAALEHYLRARFLSSQMTDVSWRDAIAEFEKSIEIAPAYAPAYVGLADLYAIASGEAIPSREAMTHSRELALEALKLDPGLASAHAVLGNVYGMYDYDWVKAEASFRRGLELNPHEPVVLQNYGQMLHVNGRFDEAMALFQRAREQDPFNRIIAVQALWPLNQGRRYDEAIRGAQAILAADSSIWYARFILGQALSFSGRRSEGIAELERVNRPAPMPLALAWLGWAYGTAGRGADAMKALADLELRAKTGVVQPYCFALVHVGLGNKDDALRWLERGADERTTEVTFIRVDPAWDPIRAEPRFVRLAERIGLVSRSGGLPSDL